MCDVNLDMSWINNFKQAENDYKDFYKEPVKSITLFLLYVNKENELERINTDTCVLSENGVLKRDLIITLIKRYQILFSKKYKLLSLLRYNIDLEPSDINVFLKEDDNLYNCFIKPEKYLDDIYYADTIAMFQELNALYFIFCENKQDNSLNQTKRIFISSCKNKNKTKRIGYNKNLKIIKDN